MYGHFQCDDLRSRGCAGRRGLQARSTRLQGRTVRVHQHIDTSARQSANNPPDATSSTQVYKDLWAHMAMQQQVQPPQPGTPLPGCSSPC